MDKGLIVQLKENHKELLSNCEDLVRFTQPIEQYAEENVEHGRIEQRKLTVYTNQGDLIMDKQWQGFIKAIFRVERELQKFSIQIKRYETSRETAYFLSNGTLSAQQAFYGIKNHWLIEISN